MIYGDTSALIGERLEIHTSQLVSLIDFGTEPSF
jgi:hypothetical protein